MKRIVCIVSIALVAIAGCSRKAEEKKAVPIAEQPRPSSSVGQIVEDMAGKTDVKAAHRARATIERVSAQEKSDLQEIVP